MIPTDKEINWTLLICSMTLIPIYRWIATQEQFELFVMFLFAGFIIISIGAYVLNLIIRFWLEIYFRTVDSIMKDVFSDKGGKDDESKKF